MKRLNVVVAATALSLILFNAGCQQKQQEEPVVQEPEQVRPAPFPHEQIPEAQTYAEPQRSPQPALVETPAPQDEEPITTIEPSRATPAPKPKTTTAKPKEKYAAPAKSGRSYVVKNGDTLQKISQRFYGTTKNWRKIYDANKAKLKNDPNKLSVGTKLVIP